jgi:hypothetical protein
MPHNRSSNSPLDESETVPVLVQCFLTKSFKLTPTDIDILKGYMDEFEKANTQAKRKILEKSMGEIL